MRRENSENPSPTQPYYTPLEMIGILFVATVIVEVMEMVDLKGVIEKTFFDKHD